MFITQCLRLLTLAVLVATHPAVKWLSIFVPELVKNLMREFEVPPSYLIMTPIVVFACQQYTMLQKAETSLLSWWDEDHETTITPQAPQTPYPRSSFGLPENLKGH